MQYVLLTQPSKMYRQKQREKDSFTKC